MKCVVITVAGIASRFNRDFSDEKLKAIYYEEDYRETILYQLLNKSSEADKIIVVGGYLFEELSQYISERLEPALRDKIELIYNEFYDSLASGYSLYVGLQHALQDKKWDEIVFVEGDLEIDRESFERVCQSKKDVFTYTSEIIDSKKAVVVYEDTDHKYHFIYSTEHGCLKIEDAFYYIYNSGQCWKFTDMDALQEATNDFVKINKADTNLLIIQKYFDTREKEQIEPLHLERWINCNTREDYKRAKEFWR